MKSKEQRFMSVARALARVSEASDLRVGAVIVGMGKIVGTGWNDEFGELVVHAEVAAINNTYYTGVYPTTMYVTTSPCLACAKAIVGDGSINMLYYQHEWWDKAALELLRECGVETKQIKRER